MSELELLLFASVKIDFKKEDAYNTFAGYDDEMLAEYYYKYTHGELSKELILDAVYEAVEEIENSNCAIDFDKE
ncbi:hypothetical protein HWC59_gp05 [Proteus phage Myduc]|uniref:Uncharacterized protein n=1 Tax=Proteus phage Myduc TaxID=2650874 RepID=A0A5J6T7H3_9CAUD|nr:hypothetical protein HWC59_gp05 [Proteus phage Myduc]QFG06628.1 hypothetical protein CPT_Myduc_005 [Proteus phage Myduc]